MPSKTRKPKAAQVLPTIPKERTHPDFRVYWIDGNRSHAYQQVAQSQARLWHFKVWE